MRFIKVLTGGFWDLVKMNLLFCACAFIPAAAFLVGLLGYFTAAAYILALIAAFPVGGAATAYVFCITKLLRDEPVFVWHDFKRKFLENIKQAALPGMLCAAFLYAQVFLWGPLIVGGAATAPLWLLPGFVFLIIFGMVAPYIFLQFAYIELGMLAIMKNSVLVSFAYAPRSFMGSIMGGAIWAVFFAFLPRSAFLTPLLILIGVSISLLLCLMWVWPVVDKQFSIVESLSNAKTME